MYTGLSYEEYNDEHTSLAKYSRCKDMLMPLLKMKFNPIMILILYNTIKLFFFLVFLIK